MQIVYLKTIKIFVSYVFCANIEKFQEVLNIKKAKNRALLYAELSSGNALSRIQVIRILFSPIPAGKKNTLQQTFKWKKLP